MSCPDVLRASPCDWPTGAVGDHRCHAVGNVMLKVPCPAKKCFADLQIFQCFCTLGVSNLIPSKTLPLANSTSPASAHSAHSATQRVGVPAAPVTVTQGAPRTSSTASPLSMATSTDRAWTRKKRQNRNVTKNEQR